MKKTFLLISFLLILTGCGNNNKNKKENDNNVELDISNANYVCEINNTEDEYNLIGKYAIYLDNDDVIKINSVEVVESDNDNTLSYFETYYLSNYDKISNYNGFEYYINKEDNKLKVNVSINYQEFNAESYVIDYPDNAADFDENFKLKIDRLLENYEKQNIKCEKK